MLYLEMIMNLVKKEFKKNGMDYKAVNRGYFSVVYEQSFNGKVIGYEAHVIRSHNGRVIAGVEIEPSEYLASNEEFGTKAFFYKDKESAMKKGVELDAAIGEKYTSDGGK